MHSGGEGRQVMHYVTPCLLCLIPSVLANVASIYHLRPASRRIHKVLGALMLLACPLYCCLAFFIGTDIYQ
jgi:hypothetical protein